MPCGVHGRSPGRPCASRPADTAREPVDVLGRGDEVDHLVGIEVIGQRDLEQDPRDLRVGAQALEHGDQLVARRVGGQARVGRLDADLLGRLVLVGDVDVRGGVVAHEHGGQARAAPGLGHERLDPGGDVGAHGGGDGAAVDHGGAHGSTVRSWRSSLSNPERRSRAVTVHRNDSAVPTWLNGPSGTTGRVRSVRGWFRSSGSHHW